MTSTRRRIGSGLLLVWTATFLLVAVVVVVALNVSLHALARREAREKAEIIVARSLATHFYFTEELKPHVFKLSKVVEGSDHFDPVWMSSTYAVRDIQARFEELVEDDYYYKECAVNARSPEYEADSVEVDFLKRANADSDLTEESLVRTFDGEPYLVLMERGEQMVEACMLCHSDPALAPKDLVAEYGPERSFGRSLGEYSSAISVRIPLAQAYKAADGTSRALSLVLLGIFGFSLGGVYQYNRRVVFVPARQYEADANALNEAVTRERGANEELLALNQELAATNEKLETEMGIREQAELELDDYKNSLEGLVSVRTSELERARSEAEHASAAKSLFLANMSHDLRTPLNSVIGFSDVLVAGKAGDLNDEQMKQLRMINESGRYLLALVNDLLDLSRIESSGEHVEMCDFDLAEVLDVVAETVRLACAEKGLEFRCECATTPLPMHSDDRLVRQLLLNLLTNAVKFTPSGAIVLRMESAPDADDVVLAIEDSGVGIAEKDLPHVFEAFSQFGDELRAKPDGAGLGLAISFKIARLLGGTITASSHPHKGSTFTVRLPREAPLEAEDEDTPL